MYFSEHDPVKKIYQGRLYQEQGRTKDAYEMYENVILSEYGTFNFALSMMAGLAPKEDDIGYAGFLSEKIRSISHTLEMGNTTRIRLAYAPSDNLFKQVKIIAAGLFAGCGTNNTASVDIGDSGSMLEEMAGTGDWQEERRFQTGAFVSNVQA